MTVEYSSSGNSCSDELDIKFWLNFVKQVIFLYDLTKDSFCFSAN